MFAAKKKEKKWPEQDFYFPVSDRLNNFQVLSFIFYGRQSLCGQNTGLGRTKTSRLFWAVWKDIECNLMQAFEDRKI